MSGELSLVGRLLPVAGIRDKLVAARRAGVRMCRAPRAQTRATWTRLSLSCLEGIEVVLAEELPEVVDKVLLPGEG